MLDIKFKLSPSHTSDRDWMAPSPMNKLFWNVTYACNFRCPICFTDAGPGHPDELTTDEAKDMLTRAAQAGERVEVLSIERFASSRTVAGAGTILGLAWPRHPWAPGSSLPRPAKQPL